MNKRNSLCSKKKESENQENGDQEIRRRPAPSSRPVPPARRIQQSGRPRIRHSRTPLNPEILSSLLPLGSRSRAMQSTNSNTVFPRNLSPPIRRLRRLIRLADVMRPTDSTLVEYRTFIGNGRVSDVRTRTIRVRTYNGYEPLVEYLYELCGAIIASLEDGASTRGVSLHIATLYYTTYQDYLRRPMRRMVCRSNWEFFSESAYRIQIRWLPFRPHLRLFLDFARRL